mgnify:FL=1
MNDQIHYEEAVDTVCIIVDSDARPVGEYKRFVKECIERGYRAYITNPKFELWILLHFDISEILDDLKNPKRVSATIDSEMKKKKIGKKTDFRPIVPKIGIALNNSAEFENDINRI